MKREKKMLIGYLTGGLLVLVVVPLFIYLLTLFIGRFYQVLLIGNLASRLVLIALLLIPGLLFAVWSLAEQNNRGEGGPLEIGNLEISPKTRMLVTSGPYRYTRNPMLFGAFLLYLAYALVLNSLSSLILVFLLFALMLGLVVPMEEKRLEKDFGEAYLEYRKSVPVFFPRFSKR
ncbi:MAG: methyltransferase family protein [Bacteroidota bacterium]